MTHLKTIRTSALGAGDQRRIPEDRRLEGDPLITTWPQDTHGENVETGIFEAEPGLNVSRKGSTYEFCHILDGVVEICENGGEPVTFRAGDTFVMKPGFVGTWRTIETVRKIYVVVDQSDRPL
jgi:uncharacterized protein